VQQIGVGIAISQQLFRDAKRISYRDLKESTETTEELMASLSSTQTQQQEDN